MAYEEILIEEKVPHFLKKEASTVVKMARSFAGEFLSKESPVLEKKVFHDSQYVSHELAQELNRRGLINLWLPRVFGGRGFHPYTMYLFNEELGRLCLSTANILGAHYVALSVLSASMNVKLMRSLLLKIEKGRLAQKPCLFSIAVTEPNAGTDVEDYRLLPKAQINCFAKKTQGGYLLNGRKMFISGSHLSSWFIVVAYENRRDLPSSVVSFAIPKGAKGFSIGPMERKMGQSLCPTAELIFSNCFIPDKYVVLNSEVLSPLGDLAQLNEILHEDVISMSRAGVGAFSAGANLRAFLIAADYFKEKPARLQNQLAQKKLAEIYNHYLTSKLQYLDVAQHLIFRGPMRHLFKEKAHSQLKKTPLFLQRLGLWWITLTPKKTQQRWLEKRFQKFNEGAHSSLSAMASMVKRNNSMRTMQSIQWAFELMGRDAIKSEYGLERLLRDSKLLEIYEGSNEINSLNMINKSKKHLGLDYQEYYG